MATDLHITLMSSMSTEDRLCYLSNKSYSRFSDYNYECPLLENNECYPSCSRSRKWTGELRPSVFVGEVAYHPGWEEAWPCFRIPELVDELPDTETPKFTVITPELIALIDGALDLTDTDVYKLGNPFWDSTGQVKGEVHAFLESHMGEEITCEWH